MEEIFIPSNSLIEECGYFSQRGIANLLRKYKDYPNAIQFIADMLE